MKAINDSRVYSRLLSRKEIIDTEYDGSYIFIDELCQKYSSLDKNLINYKDLEVFYYSCITTNPKEKANITIELKKNKIDASSLDVKSKEELKQSLESLENSSFLGRFSNSNYSFGLFLSAYGSMKSVSSLDARNLIEMFIEVNFSSGEEELFDIVKSHLNHEIKGIKTGIISVILHTLRPYIFPVIIYNTSLFCLYKRLGIKLSSPSLLKKYAGNAVKIKEYRDNNYAWKNYLNFYLESKNIDVFTTNVNEFNVEEINDVLSIEDIKNCLNDSSIITNKAKNILIQCYNQSDFFDPLNLGEKTNKGKKNKNYIFLKLKSICNQIAKLYGFEIIGNNKKVCNFQLLFDRNKVNGVTYYRMKNEVRTIIESLGWVESDLFENDDKLSEEEKLEKILARKKDLTHSSIKIEYKPSKPRSYKIINNQIKFDTKVSVKANAIILSNYSCEFNKKHKSFIRKSNGKNYTIAFHLIPMERQSDDKYKDVSLDCESNVVSLCPNCYYKLLFGKEKNLILRTLYKQRKNLLLKSGIDLKYEELIEYYKNN